MWEIQEVTSALCNLQVTQHHHHHSDHRGQIELRQECTFRLCDFHSRQSNHGGERSADQEDYSLRAFWIITSLPLQDLFLECDLHQREMSWKARGVMTRILGWELDWLHLDKDDDFAHLQ